jgi:hypothetical protein
MKHRPAPPRGDLAVRAFEDGYNLLMLLPSSNELLVSTKKPRILVYGGPNQVLAHVTGAEDRPFYYRCILSPVAAARKCLRHFIWKLRRRPSN